MDDGSLSLLILRFLPRLPLSLFCPAHNSVSAFHRFGRLVLSLSGLLSALRTLLGSSRFFDSSPPFLSFRHLSPSLGVPASPSFRPFTSVMSPAQIPTVLILRACLPNLKRTPCSPYKQRSILYRRKSQSKSFYSLISSFLSFFSSLVPIDPSCLVVALFPSSFFVFIAVF